MARKKKHKKTHHRRRVGGIGGKGAMMEGIMGIVGVGVGIIGGRILNNMLTMSPTIVGAAEGVAGGVLAVKAKPIWLKGIGMGFGGNGLIYATGSKGLGLLPATVGYGPDPMHRPTRAQLQGFRDVPKIGFPKPGAIGAPRDRARMVRQYAGIYG